MITVVNMEEGAQQMVEITEVVEVVSYGVEVKISHKENKMVVLATIITIEEATKVEMVRVAIEEALDNTIMIEEEAIEVEMVEAIVDRKTKVTIEDTTVVITIELINLEIKCLIDQIVRGLPMMTLIGFRN